MICLPFAGGSKYSYYRYVKLAPSWLRVIPVDLPGRGGRLNEPLFTDMDSIVDNMFNFIRPLIEDPYVFYGHSMGALTSLLLTRKIRKEGLRMPSQLFVSGHGGPAANDNKTVRHNLSEKELLNELSALDGMPDEAAMDENLISFFLPIIRSDFRAIETFTYTPDEKLNLPITCMIGSQEQINMEKAKAWEAETLIPVDIRQFPGKHFFIYNCSQEIMNLIVKKLVLKSCIPEIPSLCLPKSE